MTAGLPEQVRAGIAALRAGKPAQAAQALAAVVADQAFLEAPDLQDVRARVFSLLAQALLECGRPHQADPWARRALEAARALGDAAGEAEVRALHTRIFAAAATADRARRASAVLLDTPIEALLAAASGPEERAAALVKKANALLDVERAAEGLTLARHALDEAIAAGSLREEVLARITIARADPPEAEACLQQAWRRAEGADDFNLVTAVAHAADVCGVTLPVQRGPDTGPT